MIFSLFFILLYSCNEVDSKDEKEIRKFVNKWSEAHTQLKSPYLEADYMDVVTYYGKKRTRSQVQQDKRLLFEQFPDYTQQVLNNELDITKEGANYLVTFIKQVNYNGIKAEYESYLSVVNKNGDFRILREGVSENSKNLDAPIFPGFKENSVIQANKKKLYGDFNGDGLSDYATVISPEIITNQNTDPDTNNKVECKGGCNSVIVFSHKDLEDITIKGAYQSQLENLKDLNGDSADEIGFWDIKPTSKSLYVFNATNGKQLCDPVFINTAVHKNLKLIDVFKKTGPNKITVTRSAEVNGKWVLEKEVILLE
ncbi:hypothetical protein [Xanthomarina sp. F1114]|uniref:hypothetical protein n=1 Tax=Xanthomarina sp. F1114 TaxID=2996019 RepID=UPI00225DFCBD|nr:hypothetical protein [Xanthomarina sp. F1114]